MRKIRGHSLQFSGNNLGWDLTQHLEIKLCRESSPRKMERKEKRNVLNKLQTHFPRCSHGKIISQKPQFSDWQTSQLPREESLYFRLAANVVDNSSHNFSCSLPISPPIFFPKLPVLLSTCSLGDLLKSHLKVTLNTLTNHGTSLYPLSLDPMSPL